MGCGFSDRAGTGLGDGHEATLNAKTCSEDCCTHYCTGGIGAGAARLLQILVLSKFGKLDMDEIDRNWYGRRK